MQGIVNTAISLIKLNVQYKVLFIMLDLFVLISVRNNVTITSNDDKANVLGNYFSQIFTKETRHI